MKLFSKIIFAVVLAVFLVLLLLHSAPVQKRLTNHLSRYLSTTTKGDVSMDNLYFSLLGEVEVRGIVVCDPNGKCILSAETVRVSAKIIQLLFGIPVFEIQIEGLNAQIIKSPGGLNIQYLFDAFGSTKTDSSKRKIASIRLDPIEVTDAHIEYFSEIDSLNFTTNFDMLRAQDVEVLINPAWIKAEGVYSRGMASEVFSYSHERAMLADTMSAKPPSFNFGSGVNFDIRQVELQDNSFSYHTDEVKESLHFDPHHLDLRLIQVHLDNVLLREDSLAVEVEHISSDLPGFTLSRLKGKLGLNFNQAILSGLRLSSKESDLQLDLTAEFANWKDLIDDGSKTDLELSMSGRTGYSELVYFLDDSLLHPLKDWLPIEFEINGEYVYGNALIRKLNLQARNSNLVVEGTIGNLSDPKNIIWTDLQVTATLGSDFSYAIRPFIGDFNLPSVLQLRFNSSGHLADFDLDAELLTSLGTIKTRGAAGLNEGIFNLDMVFNGQRVNLGKWLELAWLGPIDFSVHSVGNIGKDYMMEIDGLIGEIIILEQPIKEIGLKGSFDEKGATGFLSIDDPAYRSKIGSEISYSDSLNLKSTLELDHFSMGKLLKLDTSFQLTGGLSSVLEITRERFTGSAIGAALAFSTSEVNYQIDSLDLRLMISPTSSSIDLHTNDINGALKANFPVQDIPYVLDQVFNTYLATSDSLQYRRGHRIFELDFEVRNATLMQLFNIEFQDFSGIEMVVKFSESNRTLQLEAGSGDFRGYGMSLDTIHVEFVTDPGNIYTQLFVEKLYYDSLHLGNLDFDVFKLGDTIISSFVLSRDSTTLLGLSSKIQRSGDGLLLYPDSLVAFGKGYGVVNDKPIFVDDENIRFDQFVVGGENFEIMLDGDPDNFNLNVKNVNLSNLNYLVSADTSIVTSGILNGSVSYQKSEQQFNLLAFIDSLVIYESPVMSVAAIASNEGSLIPFQFDLTTATNTIGIKGEYSFDNPEVYSAVLLDINDLQVFDFLAAGRLDEMSGKIKGRASITGPLDELKYDGSVRLQNMRLITSNPKVLIQIEDEKITLDNRGLFLEDFMIHDQDQNPLFINGSIKIPNLKSPEYDLEIRADKYVLINNPASDKNQLQGMLVIGGDMKLKGNKKDTYAEANIIIRDATNLTYKMPSEDIELVTSEGIIEFIDPDRPIDSIVFSRSQSFYDSLVASLPKFDLTSNVTLENDAVVRVIIDPRSGDYVELSGNADLRFSFDRTGNPQLSGLYTINRGHYQLSFYDIVKKKFNIEAGSSVSWSGNPNDGELDIHAVHTIRTSSIGLIGHEIGDNERNLYRRTLPYEVGIRISGFIEDPRVSFLLDLPPEEKVNYPPLASKLDRLRQPEYESELNKQVFGLLVLGGFIPESTGSDFNQGLIATTTLANSVNSILSSQLNRFGQQYIKGVDIDVGLQSYSDYTTGGGQTRTAMDFKLVKRMMDDRLSMEFGGSFDLYGDQSAANTGDSNFKRDLAVIYDLTESGNKKLKAFNNETYDIIYHEVRNTGVSLIFLKEFDKGEDKK